MLVLTRKRGDILRIGDNIFIELLATKKEKIRVGITAPPCVAIHRAEKQKILEENESTCLKNTQSE